MRKEEEDRIWNKIARWFKPDLDKNEPDVVVVFALRLTQNGWKCQWKCSHWMDNFEGIIPPGVQNAIIHSMASSMIGEQATISAEKLLGKTIDSIPGLIGLMLEKRQR